jgi:UDP-N-acetylmuramoyl-tripeptide--D-alanyl-D-alanine ligase
VIPGDLFVAVAGGASYLADARAHGAAATLVPADEHAALASLGRAVRNRSDARVVAITGSVGKTSTKDILAALLRGRVRVVAARDGFNNEIGVPLTLCEIEPDTQVVVTELAMRALGQIRELAEIARPDIGVITSIAPAHLGLLGSLENIARAKAELLDFVDIAIVPENAPELEPFIPEGLDVRRFGTPEPVIEGGRMQVRGVWFSFAARHQATNALAALTVLDALEIDPPEGVVEVEFSRWRSQESELPGGGLLINDAWNANPVAMRAALEHLRDSARGRRTVAILGDMAELGDDAPRFHEEIGALRNGVDVLIGVGELARGYAPDLWAATAGDAIELARAQVRTGDVVLVKGSRSVGLEVVAEALS